MDTPHHDSAESSTGFWSIFGQVLGAGFCIFALVAGGAFIWKGYKISRIHGPQPMPVAAAPAAPAAADGEIVLRPGTDNPLSYDVKSFTVKAGAKVKVTFDNRKPGAVPQSHNFILGKLGSKDRLMAAIAAMATDPNGFAKSFIPESPDIIVHTKLVNPGQSESVEFTAPAEKGDYPYMCSFPGHILLMNGTMKVE